MLSTDSVGCSTSSLPTAYLQSSCSICFEDLRQTDQISAIVCGHIYHHGCISQWMAAKKQCPSCRRTVPKNGFVEKLYFDVQRMSGETGSTTSIDYREEHYKLSTTLKVEKEKVEKLDTENKTLKTEVKSLEKKILKEKEKYRSEIPRLHATINHLQISTEETDSLKRELTDARCKLKASEFFKILSTQNAEADKQIGQYLRKGGNLDTEKFFQLQKAQIKDLTEKRHDAAREIENLRLENQSLKRKEQADAILRQTLKESILELRERANINTPVNNKRLRQVLEEETPLKAKRKSLGYDDSSHTIREDLSFYKQHENRTPVALLPSKAVMLSESKFNSDDEDDEYFKTPKLTKEAKKTIALPKIGNNDSFEFDIQVPQNIISRIPPKIPSFKKSLSRTENMNSSIRPVVKKASEDLAEKNSFDFDVPLPTTNTNKLTKPSNQSHTLAQSMNDSHLKRHQSTASISSNVSKKTVQASPVNASRISSFFKRSTSTVIETGNSEKNKYVTID